MNKRKISIRPILAGIYFEYLTEYKDFLIRRKELQKVNLIEKILNSIPGSRPRIKRISIPYEMACDLQKELYEYSKFLIEEQGNRKKANIVREGIDFLSEAISKTKKGNIPPYSYCLSQYIER